MLVFQGTIDPAVLFSIGDTAQMPGQSFYGADDGSVSVCFDQNGGKRNIELSVVIHRDSLNVACPETINMDIVIPHSRTSKALQKCTAHRENAEREKQIHHKCSRMVRIDFNVCMSSFWCFPKWSCKAV